MKKFKLLLAVATTLLCSVVFGQIKVDSQGKITMGDYWGEGPRLKSIGSVLFTQWDAGWDNFNIDWSSGVCCGTPTIYPTSSWYLQIGKPDALIGNIFADEIRCRWQGSLSDERAKENIQKLDNPLEKIMQISAYKYNFKAENYSKDLSDEVKAKITREQIGFLAQELAQEFPELVDMPTSGDENYYVNYMGMTPVLLEAIKEQQIVIENFKQETLQEKEALKREIENLKDIINSGYGTIEPKSVQTDEINSKSFLMQNSPNPFSNETEIKYFISGMNESAVLYVFNMQGALKLQKPISQKGEGVVRISASELEAGMYIYSLVINGKEVDSKRMILTN